MGSNLERKLDRSASISMDVRAHKTTTARPNTKEIHARFEGKLDRAASQAIDVRNQKTTIVRPGDASMNRPTLQRIAREHTSRVSAAHSRNLSQAVAKGDLSAAKHEVAAIRELSAQRMQQMERGVFHEDDHPRDDVGRFTGK